MTNKPKDVEELADEIHGMFASAYAIGEKVNHQWLLNVLTTHTEQRVGERDKEWLTALDMDLIEMAARFPSLSDQPDDL